MPHDPNGAYLEMLDGPSVDVELTVEEDILELVVFNQAQVVPVARDEWLELDDGRGPRGLQGPPGLGVFIHHQTSPASTWEIVHNRGTKPPVVLIIDSEPGGPVYTDVTYPDLNTLVVEWPSAESGYAYI